MNAPLKANLHDVIAKEYHFLSGETGELIRSLGQSVLPGQWSQSLKTCLHILFTSSQPVFLWWGNNAVHIYNDACRPFLGNRHPQALGQPGLAVWGNGWEPLQSRFHSMMQADPGAYAQPLMQLMEENGHYYDFSCSPVPGENGGIAGVLCIGAAAPHKAGPRYAKTDLAAFTKGLLDRLEPVFRGTGLTLVVNFDTVIADVYIDRDMWEQILLALLSNALKYTLHGGVAVRIGQEADQVRLSVSDTGIGMSGALLAEIEAGLHRGGQHKTGLPLVAGLVAGHGGQLQINSRPDEGSTFSINIPAGREHLPAGSTGNGSEPVVYNQCADFLLHIERDIRISREKIGQGADGQQFRQLLASLPAALYTCDKDGHVLQYNDAAAALWGRQPLAGTDKWGGAWKIYEPDGVTPIDPEKCPMAEAVKAGKPVNGKIIILERPDGSKRIIQPHPEPIFNARGELTGAINMLVDITDQQSTEEYISRLVAIVENSDDAIISKTLDGIVTSWNPAAERLFGFTAKEMAGQLITRIIPDDRLDEEPRIIEQLKAGQKVDHFETKRIAKNGQVLDISLTISPVKDKWGKVIGASKIARDITQRRRLFLAVQESESKYMQLAFKLEALVEQRTRELQESNFYLAKSNQELEQFAYVTSHDLQEPLRKIHTFAGMLFNVNKDTLSDTSRVYMEKIMQSARRMSQLISELLDYSRLAHMRDPFEQTNLNDILKNVIADFEVLITQHEVQLEIEELPLLSASPLQMNQLFHNLLGNAIKFSSSGRKPLIHIYARSLSDGEVLGMPELDSGSDYCAIVVKDNGIGFDQVYASKIFQIFQRLNDRSAFEGTGIGLALCNKIALNHKGLIYATGVPGEGAIFQVVLPVAQKQPA